MGPFVISMVDIGIGKPQYLKSFHKSSRKERRKKPNMMKWYTVNTLRPSEAMEFKTWSCANRFLLLEVLERLRAPLAKVVEIR